MSPPALALFTETVCQRIKGVAGYEALQTRIESIRELLDRYNASLVAARNRGISEIMVKNRNHRNLIELLNLLAADLEIAAADNEQLIVDAGFDLRAERGPAFSGKLPPPEILKAGSTGRRGEVRLVLKNAFPRAVTMHAVEYSADLAESWRNGSYHSRQIFTVEGLPSSGNLMIRVKGLGNAGRKSEWSDPVLVAVL